MSILGMSFMCHKLKHEINKLELEDMKLEMLKEDVTEAIGDATNESCGSIFGNSCGSSYCTDVFSGALNGSAGEADLDALQELNDQIEQRQETVETLLEEKRAALSSYEKQKSQDIKDGAPKFGSSN